MKLFFRGVSHEHEPLSLEVAEGEIGGRYRGVPWKTHHLKSGGMRHPLTKTELTYRGVSYRRP